MTRGLHGIILRGGPYNGVVVAPEAPALAPEWWRSWPCWYGGDHPAAGLRSPGRYVRDPAGLTATWQALDVAPLAVAGPGFLARWRRETARRLAGR